MLDRPPQRATRLALIAAGPPVGRMKADDPDEPNTGSSNTDRAAGRWASEARSCWPGCQLLTIVPNALFFAQMRKRFGP